MYSFWPVSRLRDELRRRNASVAGKKADMIERLEAYDRNENFGADLNIQEDQAYLCPPSDTFRDINADSSLPYISRREIQDYFEIWGCNIELCNYEPLKEEDILENYSDYVRNLVVGYGNTSMPLLQTYEPANPHGVEWDHSYYSRKSSQDILLEKLLLKNVSQRNIEEVELRTREQNNSSEWHELRSCRITASLFYAICHNQKPEKKYLLQKIMTPIPLHTRAIVHGRVNEPIAISKYEAEFGLNVQRCGLFLSNEYPLLAASPDGLLEEETVVEVKCPYALRNCLINEVTVPYIGRKDGNLYLKPNHPYYAQIQGQMCCTKRKYCNFIVYTYKDMKVLFVSRDQSYINEMITSLLNFYLHYLEPAILNYYIYRDYISLIKH